MNQLKDLLVIEMCMHLQADQCSLLHMFIHTLMNTPMHECIHTDLPLSLGGVCIIIMIHTSYCLYYQLVITITQICDVFPVRWMVTAAIKIAHFCHCLFVY